MTLILTLYLLIIDGYVDGPFRRPFSSGVTSLQSSIHNEYSTRPNFLKRHYKSGLLRKLAVALIIGLSDTQAITSIAYALPTLTAMRCTVSTYHFILIWYLCTIASTCHLSSALVIHQISKRWIPAILRLALTIALLVCTILLWTKRNVPIFPSFTPTQQNQDRRHEGKCQDTGLVIPAICFRAHPDWNSRTTEEKHIDAQHFAGSDLWASREGFHPYNSSVDNLKSHYDIICFVALMICGSFTGIIYAWSLILTWRERRP